MAKKRSQQQRIDVSTVRVSLFAAWTVLAFAYILYFQWFGTIKERAFSREAREAVWQIVYITLPVLTAFGTFWFTPSESSQTEKDAIPSKNSISKEQAVGLTLITMFVHGVMWAYWFFNLRADSIQRFPQHESDSVESIISSGMKLFVFMLSLAVLPVGYLTKSDVHIVPPTGGSKK